jgi:protein TonB
MNAASPVFSLPFLLAGVLSCVLHILLFWGFPGQTLLPAPPRPALAATLKAPQTPVFSEPLPEMKLDAPETSKETDAAIQPEPDLPAPSRPRPRPVPNPPQDALFGTLPAAAARSARQQLAQLARQENFYPLGAVERGWEGEALVQIFLDDNGHVIAARIERSSGHALLDEAALNAARLLRSLPADGVEEAVIPVIFRLK